jgi:hypothetical protein
LTVLAWLLTIALLVLLVAVAMLLLPVLLIRVVVLLVLRRWWVGGVAAVGIVALIVLALALRSAVAVLLGSLAILVMCRRGVLALCAC